LQVVRREIVDLIPNVANLRKHTEESIVAVKASLLLWGQQKPIVIDANNVVRCGNGTLEAAKRLGWKELDCLVTSLSGAALIAYSIADNRTAELSAWSEEVGPVLEGLRAELPDLPLADLSFDALATELPPPVATESPSEVPSGPLGRGSELQAQWGTALGQLWLLGPHRLLCGDACLAGDVGRLLEGKEPFLMVTDPPYGVEYDPEWRDEALGGEPGGRCTREVANDGQFDWKAAFKLFPGNVMYVWHSGFHVAQVQQCIEEASFAVRAHIVWVKNHFPIGRGHYHWAHESCQPAGTMVMVPNGPRDNTGLKPIEELRDGDRVVSWTNGVVKRRGAKVDVANRHYDGQLHEISAGRCKTRTTHCHHWSIRISPTPTWLVYLMRRGSRWRVGQVQSFNSRGFGPTIRLKDEKGDAVWILSTHSTLREAKIYEQAISVKYGIPTTHWEVDHLELANNRHRDYEGIDLIYRLVGPLESKALALLSDCGKYIDLPLATNDGVRGGKAFFSRKTPTVVRSCNLIPMLMEVPKPTDGPRPCEPNGAGREGMEWVPISGIVRLPFSGQVYSLRVHHDEHYIADGLITHNCWYAVREGKTANWRAGADQTTVWAIDRPHKDEYGHSTQKPLECMFRPIRNHDSELVYDPFVGSGTTFLAAEQLKRVCFGMDIDPVAVAIALERWKETTGIVPQRLS